MGGGDRLGRKLAEQLEIGIRRISMKSFRVSSEDKVERNSSLGCRKGPTSEPFLPKSIYAPLWLKS